MKRNKHVFVAPFEQNLKPSGGHTCQSLTAIQRFLTGNPLLAFSDAPWFPLSLRAIFILD